jgi:hypothetical protein
MRAFFCAMAGIFVLAGCISRKLLPNGEIVLAIDAWLARQEERTKAR